MIYYLATYTAIMFILSSIYVRDIQRKNHISELKYWVMIFIWPIVTILALVISAIEFIAQKIIQK